MLERRPRDRKVSGSNPGRSRGTIFFSLPALLSVLLYFGIRSSPVLPQWHVTDPAVCQECRWPVTAAVFHLALRPQKPHVYYISDHQSINQSIIRSRDNHIISLSLFSSPHPQRLLSNVAQKRNNWKNKIEAFGIRGRLAVWSKTTHKIANKPLL